MRAKSTVGLIQPITDIGSTIGSQYRTVARPAIDPAEVSSDVNDIIRRCCAEGGVAHKELPLRTYRSFRRRDGGDVIILFAGALSDDDCREVGRDSAVLNAVEVVKH